MTKILFADNDPHIRFLFQEELREEGYEVVVAGSARETIEMMETANPDLVVLELLLPDMSGMETLRIIKGTRREIPVVFYSTYTLPASTATLEADGLVLKTHDTKDLKETVRCVMKKRHRGPPVKNATQTVCSA